MVAGGGEATNSQYTVVTIFSYQPVGHKTLHLLLGVLGVHALTLLRPLELRLEVFDDGGPEAHLHEDDGGEAVGEGGGLLRHAVVGGDVAVELGTVSTHERCGGSGGPRTMPRSSLSSDLMLRAVLMLIVELGGLFVCDAGGVSRGSRDYVDLSAYDVEEMIVLERKLRSVKVTDLKCPRTDLPASRSP